MHTDPDETKTELNALGQVYQAVPPRCGGEDDIILLGDLNVDDKHLGDLGRIDGIRPVVTNTYTNTRQNAQYDNIIFHGPSTTEFTGRWGVFNFAEAVPPEAQSGPGSLRPLPHLGRVQRLRKHHARPRRLPRRHLKSVAERIIRPAACTASMIFFSSSEGSISSVQRPLPPHLL